MSRGRLGESAANVTVMTLGTGTQPTERWPSTPNSATVGVTASAPTAASVENPSMRTGESYSPGTCNIKMLLAAVMVWRPMLSAMSVPPYWMSVDGMMI